MIRKEIRHTTHLSRQYCCLPIRLANFHLQWPQPRPHTTLAPRLASTHAKLDCGPSSMELSPVQEVVLERITDLDSRGFFSMEFMVQDMVNQLLEPGGGGKVGTKSTFKREPDLKTSFSRKYDYKSDLWEGLGMVQTCRERES